MNIIPSIEERLTSIAGSLALTRLALEAIDRSPSEPEPDAISALVEITYEATRNVQALKQALEQRQLMNEPAADLRADVVGGVQ